MRPPLRLPPLLLLLLCLCPGVRPGPAAGPHFCGCPRQLPAADCAAEVVLYLTVLPSNLKGGTFLARWRKLDPRFLKVVFLASKPEEADAARALHLPCICASATVDGALLFPSAVHKAQTSCPAGVVGLLRAPLAPDDPAAFVRLVQAVARVDWAYRELALAPPFGAYARLEGHGGLGWVGVAAPLASRGRPGPAPYLWLWNTLASPVPLAAATIPPFPSASAAADAWLLAAAARTAARHVIDLTSALPLRARGPSIPPPAAPTSPNVTEWLLYRPFNASLFHGGRSFRHPTGFGVPWEARWRAVPCNRSSVCVQPRSLRLNYDPAIPKPPYNCQQKGAKGCLAGMRDVMARSRAKWDRLRNRTLAPQGAAPNSTASLEWQLPRRANKQRCILLTTASYGYMDFVANFVCNLAMLHVTNYLIAAVDMETYEECVARGFPTFLWLMKEVNARAAASFLDKNWNVMTRLRVQFILRILELGYSILYVDLDIVLFRNPFLEIPHTAVDPMMVQSDRPLMSKSPPELTSTKLRSKDAPTELCAGMFFLPASQLVTEAIRYLWQVCQDPRLNKGRPDQPLYNYVFCNSPRSWRDLHRNLCLFRVPALNRTLEVGFWPQMYAANGACGVQGKFFFSYKYASLDPVVPGLLSLHNNWIVGKAAKVARQKDAGLWWADPTGMCLT
eukprot:EG_transcript_5285